MSWTYDAVSWLVSLGQWRNWQKAAIPYLSGSRILEVAHGPGHMLVGLAGLGYEVAGCDLSPYMVKQAAGNIVKAREDVKLVRADIRYLPYRSGWVDTVLSTFPAEFIVDPKTLKEFNRVLATEGRVVIVAEGRLKGGGALRRFIDWLFTITGQRVRPEEEGWAAELWKKVEDRIHAAGFSLDKEIKDLGESEVTIVILTKKT